MSLACHGHTRGGRSRRGRPRIILRLWSASSPGSPKPEAQNAQLGNIMGGCTQTPNLAQVETLRSSLAATEREIRSRLCAGSRAEGLSQWDLSFHLISNNWRSILMMQLVHAHLDDGRGRFVA